MIVLRIEGNPTRQFYGNASALADLEAGVARHELLVGVGPIHSGTENVDNRVSVQLRNRNNECTKLFALPPLGAKAQLVENGVTVFCGIVHDVSLDADVCVLNLTS